MRGVQRALIALPVLLPLCAYAADEKLTIDLNSVEASENRCRMNFVVENKGDAGLESLKLDLVVFGTDGGITRRLITEMGPIRAMKTSVRDLPGRHRLQVDGRDPGQRRHRLHARQSAGLPRRARPVVAREGNSALQMIADQRTHVVPSP